MDSTFYLLNYYKAQMTKTCKSVKSLPRQTRQGDNIECNIFYVFYLSLSMFTNLNGVTCNIAGGRVLVLKKYFQNGKNEMTFPFGSAA